MKLANFLFITFFISSCASTMPGKRVDSGSPSITATVEEDNVLSDKRIKMLQISLKNETDDWLEFDGATLEEGKNIEVLVGDRIAAWIDAQMLERRVSDYNWNLALATVAVGGAVVTGASQHQPTAEVGALVAIGALSGSVIMDFQDSKRRTEFQRAFPDRHIFRPFVIPPRKVIQRWILLENKKEETVTIRGKSSNGIGFQLVIDRVKESKAMSQRAI
jgi:hypothetical protein